MLRMSCSADYYFEWNGRLDPSLQTEPKRQIFCNFTNPRKYAFVNIGSTIYSVLPTLAATTIRHLL